MYGEKPEGARHYVRQGKFEFIVWGPAPTKNRLCIGATGKTESQLVRDILDGKYNHILRQDGRAVAT